MNIVFFFFSHVFFFWWKFRRYHYPGIKEAISRPRGYRDKHGTRLPLMGGLPGGDAEWANWKVVLDDMEELEKAL